MKHKLTDFWFRFREAVLTPARVVPLVQIGVGAAASYIVALGAKYGLHLDRTLVLGFSLPLVIGSIGTALHWQVGNRQYEAALQDERLRIEGLKE